MKHGFIAMISPHNSDSSFSNLSIINELLIEGKRAEVFASAIGSDLFTDLGIDLLMEPVVLI